MLSDFMKEIPSGHSTRGECSMPDLTLSYTHIHICAHKHTHTHSGTMQRPTHSQSEIESACPVWCTATGQLRTEMKRMHTQTVEEEIRKLVTVCYRIRSNMSTWCHFIIIHLYKKVILADLMANIRLVNALSISYQSLIRSTFGLQDSLQHFSRRQIWASSKDKAMVMVKECKLVRWNN